MTASCGRFWSRGRSVAPRDERRARLGLLGVGLREVAITRLAGMLSRYLAREKPKPEEVPVINQTLGWAEILALVVLAIAVEVSKSLELMCFGRVD